MFGNGKPNPNVRPGATPPSNRPKASDVAQIEGGGLVQVIVTEMSPLNFRLFLNDREIDPLTVESLNVVLEAPDPNFGGSPTVRATLAHYVGAVSGGTSQQRQELFPCTVELVAVGRRVSVTCTQPDSLDGAYISLGLKSDGAGSDVSGARSLNILLTNGLLDARLTWDDGETENLLPQ